MVAIDINGGIIERYEYDAYGSVTTYNADYSQQYTASQINNPYAFTGRRLDVLDGGNLERMHYRYRDYSMAMGRFMQQDPLEYIDSLGLYEYVTGKPTISADPEGRSVTAAAIVIAAGEVVVAVLGVVGTNEAFSECHHDGRRIFRQKYQRCAVKCSCPDRWEGGLAVYSVEYVCVRR